MRTRSSSCRTYAVALLQLLVCGSHAHHESKSPLCDTIPPAERNTGGKAPNNKKKGPCCYERTCSLLPRYNVPGIALATRATLGRRPLKRVTGAANLALTSNGWQRLQGHAVCFLRHPSHLPPFHRLRPPEHTTPASASWACAWRGQKPPPRPPRPPPTRSHPRRSPTQASAQARRRAP